VGSDHSCTVRELAEQVSSLLGGRGVVIEGSGGVADRYVPDISRLRTELNFDMKVPLDEAILKTAAWYRTQVQ
jgi:nucleoside-diphosphate-sugar epimerase